MKDALKNCGNMMEDSAELQNYQRPTSSVRIPPNLHPFTAITGNFWPICHYAMSPADGKRPSIAIAKGRIKPGLF